MADPPTAPEVEPPPPPVHGNQQQQQDGADEQMEDAPPLPQIDADLKAAQDAVKACKIDKIDGKQPKLVEEAAKTARFRLKLHIPRLTLVQLALAFMMCLTGKVMAAVIAHWGEAALAAGAVAVDDLVAFVVRGFASSKPRTNFSTRDQLQALKPQKAAHGRDYMGYCQEFQQLLSHVPDRPDDRTLIFWVMKQLPAVIQQQLQQDPATPGQEFGDFQVFMQHVTRHVAVLQRQQQGDQQQHDPSSSSSGGKRKQNAHRHANKKAKVAPENRPGFVPGLSKEKRQEMAAAGLCFKCGKPGHTSKQCKASK